MFLSFDVAKVLANSLKNRDQLRPLGPRNPLPELLPERFRHLVDADNDIPARIGDRNQLYAPIGSPTGALDEPLAFETIDEGTCRSLAHAEAAREIRLAESLHTIQVDQRRNLTLIQPSRAELEVVDAHLKTHDFGEQKLELAIGITTFHPHTPCENRQYDIVFFDPDEQGGFHRLLLPPWERAIFPLTKG